MGVQSGAHRGSSQSQFMKVRQRGLDMFEAVVELGHIAGKLLARVIDAQRLNTKASKFGRVRFQDSQHFVATHRYLHRILTVSSGLIPAQSCPTVLPSGLTPIIALENLMMDSPDRPGDEPTLFGEEWVEHGGEPIWAVDFTPGGAPIGLTLRAFRQLNAQLEHRAGWARAKALLAWAFEACSSPGADVEVGRVTKIGDGLSRRVYAARVELTPDPDRLSGAWAVLLTDHRATPEDCRRWVREVPLLGQIAREQLPFRVPAPLGAFPDGDGPAIIRRFIDGIPVDLRAGRMQSVRPAELVGQIAAAIHAIDFTDWPRRPPGAATRRSHAEEVLRVFDDLEGTEAEAAREWAIQHLPPDRAAVLIHGDLLGQNILVFPDKDPAVIDWEFCRMGDPAYDLAIVTRGVRRPFQMGRGLDRLLDAYSAAGGDPITRPEVHLHELCLAAGWYREALQGSGSEPPEQALARLRGILRRAEEST